MRDSHGDVNTLPVEWRLSGLVDGPLDGRAGRALHMCWAPRSRITSPPHRLRTVTYTVHTYVPMSQLKVSVNLPNTE